MHAGDHHDVMAILAWIPPAGRDQITAIMQQAMAQYPDKVEAYRDLMHKVREQDHFRDATKMIQQ